MGLAIARAKFLLIQYELLSEKSEKYTYTSAISYLKDYLYLADVWKSWLRNALTKSEFMSIINYEDQYRNSQSQDLCYECLDRSAEDNQSKISISKKSWSSKMRWYPCFS